ncbi:MAG: hypothetical protein KF784_14375 [Fimbriimonadaceae bacterium]|nr:hypothetical protein [Fimbriimonadaceae bacterium]
MRRMWIFGILAGVVLVSGCGSGSSAKAETPEAAKSRAVEVTLTKGQPVQLMLAKRLDAGSCKQGDYVPLLVAEDLQDAAGNIVFPRGSVVDGEVTWSRSEGTLSGVMGQPARLEIKLKGLKLDSNHFVALCADADDSEKAYAFNRSNTGVAGTESTRLEQLLQEEVSRQTLEKVSMMFNGEDVDLDSEESKAALDRIAQELGLNQTKRTVESGRSGISGVNDSIRQLQKGNLLTLANGEGALALGAVMELANLAGQVGGKLSASLKGRTIRAYPGTRLTAYVTEDSKVTIFVPQS